MIENLTIQFVETDSQKIYNDLILRFQQAIGETLYQGTNAGFFWSRNLLSWRPCTTPSTIPAGRTCSGLPAENSRGYRRADRYTAAAGAEGQRDAPLYAGCGAGDEYHCPGRDPGHAGRELYFATLQPLVILAGQTAGDAQAESTEAGAKYNGFVAGQINQIVDPVAFVPAWLILIPPPAG